MGIGYSDNNYYHSLRPAYVRLFELMLLMRSNISIEDSEGMGPHPSIATSPNEDFYSRPIIGSHIELDAASMLLYHKLPP